ncbi:MAG: hypothetical protein V4440_14560 [Pseudomonadota bacterium]
MTTALDIIKDAMDICGVIGQNETPTSSEADTGLKVLNNMLALWANDRTFAYTTVQNNSPLTNGVNSYTIGTGGVINVQRPVTIDYAFIRLNNVDYPLQKINNQDYDSIPFKTNKGFPQAFYFEASFPLATIYLYGVPQANMTLYFDTWIQLTQFTNLSTDLTFPPGYEMAISHNLAKFLAPRYGEAISPDMDRLAVDSLAMIRERNMPDLVMKTEIGLIGGRIPYGYGAWSY